MAGFVLRPRARDDLGEIWDYTALHWSRDQADRYVRLLNEAFRNLASGTVAGRSAEAVRPGYLKVAVGAHVIFFTRTDNGTVDIVRVLHQRMDIQKHL